MTGWGRLEGRRLPVQHVRLPLDPAAHTLAEEFVQDALARGDGDLLAAARARLAELPILEFEVRTLPPEVWEGLVDEHPPTPEQQALNWSWNTRALRFPALAAAVTLAGESPLTAQQWAAHAKEGRLSSGELDLLFATIVDLNARAARISLGKGSS